MINNLSTAVHAFPICMLTALSVDKILLPKYVNKSTNLGGLLLNVEMALSWLKYINSVLFALTVQPNHAAFSALCSRDPN